MLSASGADHRGTVRTGQVRFKGFFARKVRRLSAFAPACPALLAAPLLTIPVPLFALALLAGFLIRRRDGVKSGTDNRAGYAGSTADDRNTRPGDGPYQTPLKHQCCAEKNREGDGPC